MTQKQLAGQLHCSTITLRKIESEERRPSAQMAQRLAEIFNIPQGEQASFLRFARGDWRSAPRERAREAPWRSSTASPRSNLPSSITTLIGREQDLANLNRYLLNPSVRLVTLIGPPGTGKTSLCLQVAREALANFYNGVFFVRLASIEDPRLVAPAVVQTLGFVETPNRSPFEQLKEGIGDKQILIVLDNVEHLIDRTASLVSDLLSACARLKILTTSREALRVPGEWLYFVSPLNIPEEFSSIDPESLQQFSALMLFAERARAVQPDFALTADNVQSVATLCSRLDGLPLAIELVAARVRLMSLASLLANMNDRFILSADGMRTVSTRQRTLNNAIDWSYNLLSDKEQVLFRRLAVFSGGWTLDAAQAVCSGNDLDVHEIPGLVMHLVDKSLVFVRGQQESEERYQLLETIRQYAKEKLVEFHETEQVRNRHLDFFMKMAEEGEPKVNGVEQMIWLERLEIEMDNFRTSLRWGFENRAEAGFRLVGALWIFWFMHNHLSEGNQWFDEALSISLGASPLIRIRLLNGAASMAMGRFDVERTAAYSEQCLALSREQENDWGLALSLHHLGIAVMEQGDYKQAQSLLQEGLTLARKIGNWVIASYLLSDLFSLAERQGDFEHALVYCNEAMASSQKHKDRWISSYVFRDLALLAYRQFDYPQAKSLAEQAFILANETKDKRLVSSILELIGMIALRQAKPQRAAMLISAAETLSEAIGIPFILEEQNIKTTIREQLGDAKIEALMAEGRAMTMEQVVAFTLENRND